MLDSTALAVESSSPLGQTIQLTVLTWLEATQSKKHVDNLVPKIRKVASIVLPLEATD